jgi:cellulose synthase/poly-beta-1,6-N-acetylglucosamine synthase-like glycosyltransferase
MSNFDNADIGAVTSSMSVEAPTSLLEKMQEAEYLFGILMRHSFATVNGLYVTPGPFTIYRKKIFEDLGPFTPAHHTEDMEIALRMQRAGWKIQNAPNASVFTKAPTTVGALIKQRTRWTTGFLRNGIDYRDMVGNPKKGVLGLLVLPMAFLSVVSGILIMSLLLWKTGDMLWHFVVRALEVPLSYTFSFNGIDLFFFSIDPITVLSLVAILIIFSMIIAGARIAEKKTNFGASLVWYFLVYSAIAAVWQFRAVADVVAGNRRSWR